MRQLKITQRVTNHDLPSLDKYLQEIAREEMISPEEELELAQRIREGDKKALEKLVLANLRFVVSVSKQYQNQGLLLPDLINEGNIGLIKAAERFDETMGFKFISYAVWYIRQSILQAISEQARMVRIPINQTSLLSKINKLSSRFLQEYEREPSSDELATSFNLPKYKINDALNNQGCHFSLDSSWGENENNRLLDILTDENSPSADGDLMKISSRKEVERLLKTLHGHGREREVIEMLFGLGEYEQEMSKSEVASKLGLTKERVRQLMNNAIRRIKKQLNILNEL
ncbi:MAG: RNA polymerase sigma factor RpoD/SigA [Candidatus Paceibacterota bacterium]